MVKKIHPMISHSIEEMLLTYNLKYYAEFLSFVSFFEENHMPSCGVNVTTRMNFFYNSKFLTELLKNQQEVNFVVVHEVFHLLFDHYSRTKNGGYNPRMSNIAQDMIINELVISDMPKGFCSIPDIGCLRMPVEYTGKRVFEILYLWLMEEKEKYDKWQKEQKEKDQDQGEGNNENQDQGQDSQDQGEGKPSKDQGKGKGKGKGQESKDQGEGQESKDQGEGKGQESKEQNGNGQNSKNENDKCPVSDQLKKIFDNMNQEGNPMDIGQLDEHMKQEGVSQEVREQVIKDVMDNLKNRGLVTANVEKTLEGLRKSKKNYLKKIKSKISQMKGTNNSRSFKKPNRRGMEGIKGKIKNSNELVCILDTSGSMHGNFEKVISYLLHGDQIINVIQIDTEVKNYEVCKSKRDFNKFTIHGGGGTVLQPAINYMKEHKKLKDLNLVILTDGCTDTLNLSGIKKTLILSCETATPVSNGRYDEIIIKDD